MLNQRSLILKHIYIYMKEMATHSSIPAWKIPWTEEPGGLQSMESQRVRHDWATECAHARTHTHTHTRTHICSHSYFSWGSWQTTLVFLLQESHRQYEKTKRCNTRRWAPPRSKGVQYAIREERRLLAIINSSRESDTTEVTQQQQQP